MTQSRSEEHTSELQSHHPISYAVFCLKKKKKHITYTKTTAMIKDDINKIKKEYNKISSLHSIYTLKHLIYFFFLFFFFNDTATTEIYTGWYTLSLHDALPIFFVVIGVELRRLQPRK